jgi:cohesin loading factor subunit SCC2
LTAALLGQELSNALKRVNISLEHPDNDEELNLKDSNKLLAFGQRLKAALRDVWKDPATDVFDVG